MGVLNKPKSEMIPEELKKQEKEEFNPGPLSVLTPSVKNSTQVLISSHMKKKLLGYMKAADRHCSMVLENVKEMWTKVPKSGKGEKKSKPVRRTPSPRSHSSFLITYSMLRPVFESAWMAQSAR
uniref:Small nuclear ribonucleoprotein Sm D2 n=2 Tax=Ursus TaxID=9639 RepID=A0A452T1G8_URSMA